MAGLISLVLVAVLAPILGKELIFAHPELKYLFWPSLIFIWLTAIPVFISLYLFYLISHEIIKDNPFYIKNVSRLTIVNRLALLEAAFYLFVLLFKTYFVLLLLCDFFYLLLFFIYLCFFY